MPIPEEWKKQIEDYQNSGMIQKDWCEANGISKGTFCYRLKRVRESNISNSFFELKPKKSFVKIQWKGLSVELDPEFDEKTVQRLLSIFSKLL